MANQKEMTVPDIGGATDVDVIEILVNEGDAIEKDTPLITLESDKASMDIPAQDSGIVQKIKLKVGDKVSEGDVILMISQDEKSQSSAANNDEQADHKAETATKKDDKKPEQSAEQGNHEPKEEPIHVPDIGGASQVDVIDVLVSEGDEIAKDTPLITLESDKASMDIPAPKSGQVKALQIKVGDKVSEGDVILSLLTADGKDSVTKEMDNKSAKEAHSDNDKALSGQAKDLQEGKAIEPALQEKEKQSQEIALTPGEDEAAIPAGPAVRRIAHEFGVNLANVRGTGRKSRITKEDIQRFVKAKLQEKPTSGALALPEAPSVDFSKFGEIEVKPLNKIKRLTGVNVHRSWVSIPHVTQFDEADITELEAFRKSQAETTKKEGYKLTLLAFVCKVVSKALEAYPQFNSSLDKSSENLIVKHYYNIGVAVDTPNGLVVPVIKDVNRLSVGDIAKEMARLSLKAREKGLMPADMSGGCMTISSLGGIGGTAFTPIVNSPEVAILGLSRSFMKPVYQDGTFVPRLMLPLSLSYDHRVIDGAEAARFSRYISDSLGDIRKIIL